MDINFFTKLSMLVSEIEKDFTLPLGTRQFDNKLRNSCKTDGFQCHRTAFERAVDDVWT